MNTLQAKFEIDLDGKKVAAHLSINAFRILTQKFGVKLDGLDKYMQEDPMTALPAVAYCGVLNASMRKGEKFEMGFDQFCAILLDSTESMETLSEAISAAFGTEDDSEGEGKA